MAKTEIHSRRRKPKSPHSHNAPGFVYPGGDETSDVGGVDLSTSPGPALSTDSGGAVDGHSDNMDVDARDVSVGMGRVTPSPQLAPSVGDVNSQPPTPPQQPQQQQQQSVV